VTMASSSGSSAPANSTTTLGDLIAALPDLGMAALFLAAWIDPPRFGPDVITYLVLVMILEFIVIHSAAFMGAVAFGDLQVQALLKWGKAVGILGLGLFYSLFVLGFCLGFHTWWPMAAFWGLVGNRLLGATLGGKTTEENRQFVMGGWAVGVMAYLFGAFATLLLPVPRLGITGGLSGVGEGIWIDQPWKPVAMGVIYFGLVGWYELRWRKWAQSAETGIGATKRK
jgi:hypothetical protein